MELPENAANEYYRRTTPKDVRNCRKYSRCLSGPRRKPTEYYQDIYLWWRNNGHPALAEVAAQFNCSINKASYAISIGIREKW